MEVNNGNIVKTEEMVPPEHVPGLYPKWVAQLGVTDVIAGGMGQQSINLFNQQNVNAFVGAPVLTAGELVSAFLSGSLELNANYCNHDDQHEHGNCGH